MEEINQDAPMQAEGAEEKAVIPQPLDHFLVPINILLVTKTAQNQNGLKQDDYYRYSKYCSRKIHRVRKATKFTQGQRRYVKNDIKLEDLEKVKKNQRALQIPLFQSERDWSQATFLRKQLTEGGEDFIRNKYGARKRFKRALQYATQLFDIIHECGYDSQTCLEVEAYKAFIKSAFDIEYGRFKDALDELIKVNIIYSRLSKNKDLLEALIYQEKVDQIQPLIRLCTYNTGQGGVDVSKLEEDYDKQHKIHERISQSTVDTRKVGVDKIEEITYQGKSISLKTEKLKNSFHKLELQLNALHNTENDGDEVSLSEKVKAHTD